MISIIITCFNESEIINEFVIALNKEIFVRSLWMPKLQIGTIL